MNEFPEQMFRCIAGKHYSGTGSHVEYFLINKGRPYNTNIVDHFQGHSRIKEYMDIAKGKGEDLERAASSILELLDNENRKKTGTQQTLLGVS
jgi:hypothetical protein